MDESGLNDLGIHFKKGRKGPNDKIIYYHDKPISMRELGELYAILCKNETNYIQNQKDLRALTW